MIGRVALLVTFKKAKPKSQSLSRSHIRDLGTIYRMKLTLNDRIYRRTNLSFQSVCSILQSGTLQGLNLFPDRIMTGTIENGKVRAVINPPLWVSDPFRSRVRGTISQDERQVTIDFKIRLSWVIIAFYAFWYSIHLMILIKSITNDSNVEHVEIEVVEHMIASLVLPLILGKLKVYWDRTRLENWIKKNIETVPNNVYDS